MSKSGGSYNIDSGRPDFSSLGLVIKVHLGNDVRCIPIMNEDLTFDELLLMMQRVYRGKLTSSDEVVIKYHDDDGDLVTIADSSDLSFAVQNCHSLLHLTLFVNGVPRLPHQSTEVQLMRTELLELRDKVEEILSMLNVLTTSTVVPPVQKLENDITSPAASVDDTKHGSVPVKPTQPLSPMSGREFDPLTRRRSSFDEATQQKVLSSFGISAAAGDGLQSTRSGTPDSVSNIGSNQIAQYPPRPGTYQGDQTSQGQQGYGQVVYHDQQTGQTGYIPNAPANYGQMGVGAGGYVGQHNVQAASQYPQQQYVHQGSVQSGVPTGVAGNPYARTASYGGHYPRPQGEFPQSS